MRSEFTLSEFEAYKKAYWLMPTTWSDPGRTLIADLKRSGGAAAVSILPLLGRIAASPEYQPWAISAEELGRICGVDPKGVRRARDVLTELGLVSTEVRQRHGTRLLHWRVKSCLVADVQAHEPYFYFSFRLLYGGHWSEMSAVQRAVYLAAGTLASVFKQDVSENPLCKIITRDVSLEDVEKGRRFGGAAPDEYRLACASYADLSRISGYDVSAIKRAVKHLKCPWAWSVWPDLDTLFHAPLWMYPTRFSKALVYHFRDHVAPWSWAIENARVGGLPRRRQMRTEGDSRFEDLIPAASPASKAVDETRSGEDESGSGAIADFFD